MIRLLLQIAMLIIFSGSAFSSGSMTLDQCLDTARSNSPELRIAANAIRASEMAKTAAKKARWPSISFAGNAGYAPVSLDFGYDPAVSNGGELGARIVAEQTLYNGGLNGLDIRQASVEKENRTLVYQQQERNLVASIRQAFISLLLARREAELRDSSVIRLNEYLSLVERLNEAGTVSYTDLLSTRVDLNNAQIEARKALESVESARIDLARLIGMPNDTTLTIRGSLDSLLISPDNSTGGIPEIDLGNNLDIVSARAGYVQSRIALAQTKAQWRPSISLVADAGAVTSRENLLLPEPERYNSLGYSVGITFQMPLWDWGIRKAEIEKGRLELQSSSAMIDLVRRDVLTDYRTARSQLIGALDRLGTIRSMMETAQKNYLLSTAQYADGSVTATVVLAAQQMLTDAHQTEIETLAEIQSLKARLAHITQSTQDVLP